MRPARPCRPMIGGICRVDRPPCPHELHRGSASKSGFWTRRLMTVALPPKRSVMKSVQDDAVGNSKDARAVQRQPPSA